ncbi:MAG TPA: hydrolase 2, exosortase A system-associated [Burkholderiaceae bacterium]|nr:hydrolase 2, exosortase A system-associated [Burkholderiaceae bacterium]
MRPDWSPNSEVSARFEPAPAGSRFVLTYLPSGAERGTIVFAAPFAEEMNKSRRMVAQASRALAAAGWRVIECDLYGCGDSAGEFSEATWEQWVADLGRIVQAEAQPNRALWLWGLRAGALLLPPLLESHAAANVLLWQPALDGAQVLGQFLRMRTAASLLEAGNSIDRRTLREQLARGESVEVAGYVLGAGLANGLALARLHLPPDFGGSIVWIDVAEDAASPQSVAAEKLLASWHDAGHAVDFQRVAGPAFWQTVEIAEVPELSGRTVAALERALPAAWA